MVAFHHYGICNTKYALGKTNIVQHKGSSFLSEVSCSQHPEN